MDYLSHTDKCVIYLDSADRLTGTSDNFIIDLSRQIPPNAVFDSVTLCSAAIPKSWWIINATNNILNFTENGTPLTATIGNGNYSAADLGTQIGAVMSAASTISATYTLVLNTRLGQYYFTTNNAAPTTIDFTAATGLEKILGFDASIYTFTALAILAPYVCNLQLTNVVQINSSLVGGADQVLCEIIPDSISYSTLVYNEQNAGLVAKPMKNTTNSIFSFNLVDTDERAIDLHGLNWSAVIVLFRANSFYKKMLEEMQINAQEKNLDSVLESVQQ